MSDQISRQLREAAEAHQPDRVRMLARVNRGMAATTAIRPASGLRRSWSRVTLAGVAAAGVLVTAGIAFAGIVRTGPPAETTMPAAPNSVSSTTMPPSPTPPSPTGSSSAPQANTQQTVPPGTTNSPAGTENRLADGPLSSTGSVDPHSHAFWTEDKIVLELTQPLTKFSLQVRIAQTGGVQSSGHWQTGPGDDYTVTVQEIDGEVVYRWELKPGHTVPAAQQKFGVQFNQTRGARDAKADKYGVTATAEGKDYAVWGGFKP